MHDWVKFFLFWAAYGFMFYVPTNIFYSLVKDETENKYVSSTDGTIKKVIIDNNMSPSDFIYLFDQYKNFFKVHPECIKLVFVKKILPPDMTKIIIIEDKMNLDDIINLLEQNKDIFKINKNCKELIFTKNKTFTNDFYFYVNNHDNTISKIIIDNQMSSREIVNIVENHVDIFKNHPNYAIIILNRKIESSVEFFEFIEFLSNFF